MKCFQSSLPDGSFLNSTIELLENTSQIISIFRDKRPITHLTDDLVEKLKSLLMFFSELEEFSH